MPAVSVIITVYNGAEYLSECLDSILAQTLTDIEIICVDDASTDDTPRILSKYQDRLQTITNTSNCMAGESRNKGLKIARGEYVIFLDADDIYEPDMLKKAYDRAQACRTDICIFKEDTFTESSNRSNSYPYSEVLMEELGKRDYFRPQEISDMLFGLWNGWAWDKLFRRDFILDMGLQFQNLQSSNDAFFVHSAMAAAGRISLLNEVLVHHRMGNKRSVSNTRDAAWESCLIYLKGLKRYLDQKGLFPTYEKSYVNWALRFLYWNYQTLNDINRSQLTEALNQFFIYDLSIGKYEESYFFDAFSYWFAHCIMSKGKEKIPLTERELFEKHYRLNSSKIWSLKEYIEKKHWKIALWGAGIRGQAFVKVYASSWKQLHIVYDMDPSKQGQKLYSGVLVKGFDEGQADKVDCILVMNSAHTLSVCGLVNRRDTVIFDLNTYLTLSDKMNDCIM